ncbi:hypothetical protein [Brazilian marseillevirus]|uniref:hypothetical protein n=1 Tax=Brazilian marseillevirus TaxID=1813599 RepID=UPI000784A005|nr:hypothetical protein A3303_gp439 [Brazilian marseillevirus]AMQ10947.1 hypothetical protein [Brazilian marseillevirus]
MSSIQTMNLFDEMAQTINNDIKNIKDTLERLRYEKAWILQILADKNFQNIS